ncbi:hypothetical protein ABT340_15100 [Streptosporangium sp. NPDC000239]|uniref:hypothetical protein n=1 Tax=Streptosporangium sp. NPDC000239 TaxID=3154248 RepID=UPI003331E7FA
MTNIESELRDLLRQDAERWEGAGGGVTVARVHERVRGIRRRRIGLLGGAAGVGLAVAATLILPVTGAPESTDDTWNGVMSAASSPGYGVASRSKVVLDERFTKMGERVAFDIPRKTDRGNATAMISCPRGAELLYWEDGVYRNALSCAEWLPGTDKKFRDGVNLTVRRGSRFEVAVLPAGSVARLGRTLVTGEDARRVLDLANGGRADMRFRVTDTWIEPCENGPDCTFVDGSTPEPTVTVTVTPSPPKPSPSPSVTITITITPVHPTTGGTGSGGG